MSSLRDAARDVLALLYVSALVDPQTRVKFCSECGGPHRPDCPVAALERAVEESDE